MYVINDSKQHNEKATSSNKKYAIFLSEEKLEKPERVDGDLYRIVYQRNTGPNIGVLDNNYIKSGIGKTKHYNLIERVEPIDLSVKILNTDGKQKGRELVGENIGNIFPIVEVGPHDTYKYMVDIDGERIALSLENVLFTIPETEIKEDEYFKFIKYRGVTLFVNNYEQGVVGCLECKDFKTSSTMYVYDNNYEVIDDAIKIGIGGSTKEFIDKENLLPIYEDIVYEYGGKNLDFGLNVPIKKRNPGGRHYVFIFYVTTNTNFQNLIKSLPKNFKHDKNNQVIYFKG